MSTDYHTDLLVIGSGAGGLAAALTAREQGLEVLVVEKTGLFGGASAISGGAIWIPGNRQARAAGLDSDLAAARTYLEQVIGPDYDAALIEAYLTHGAEALAFLESHTELRLRVRPHSPDYHGELAGASDGGRVLEVETYDGRALGPLFEHLRPPPASMLLFGGMMVNRVDVQHFLDARRSWRSLRHCLGLLTRYARDRLRHARGTRLTVGNALMARLLASTRQRNIPLWRHAAVDGLLVEDGVVTGARILHEGRLVQLSARRGVVLATGGFGASPEAPAQRPGTGDDHRSMTPAGSTGDGLRLGEAAGAAIGSGLASRFYWAPVSVLRRADGSTEAFPHLVTDRAKPGMIAVDRQGRRFVNEADSYHRFVTAMLADPARRSPCHLLCDSRALAAYGLGLARPAPAGNQALIRAGYLLRADSLEALATQMGVDPATLAGTVARYNAHAREGRDPDFGKGDSSYNRAQGDPGHPVHPCLAALEAPPFYAVRLHTGDLGSAAGMRTDANARVLDARGQPVPGLYAAGNDMHSIMNGTYPGPGITLGPALTFGYLAGRHAARRDELRPLGQTVSAPPPSTSGEFV